MNSENSVLDSSGQQLLNQSKTDSYAEIAVYSFQNFLKWWYVKMPIWHFKRIARASVVLDDNLSISLLFRHFFVPWHRDYSLIGFFFGFLIKLFYLPIAISIYLMVMLTSLILVLVWLFLPVATLVYMLISLF